MELVLPFLRDLAKRVVPTCDPDVVASVFAVASSGYGGSRLPDGRKASWLTGSGIPFEASVTGGGGRPELALRYSTEAAIGKPFFVPRLVEQRVVLEELFTWLPPTAQAHAGELRRYLDLLYPDPGVAPARIRFATTFGIVHRSDQPEHIARLKLYGNATICPGALDRLAEAWPSFGELADRTAGIPNLRPTFTALELEADGRLTPKLYLRREGCGPEPARLVAERFGVSLDAIDAPLAVWERPGTLSVSAEAGRPALRFSLSSRGWSEDPTVAAAVAAELAQRHYGSTEMVDALRDAAAADPATTWRYAVFDFGLTEAGVGKLNLYLVPTEQ